MILDLFLVSLKNLMHRRLRSYLTIIGILIGIAAVVALISLSKGMEQAIKKQFEEAGSNTITIMGSSGGITSPMVSLISTKPITEDDKKIVESVKGVDFAGGILFIPSTIKLGKEKENIFLSGVDPGPLEDLLLKSENIEVIEGRPLEQGDKYKALIGYLVSRDLFSRELHPGDKIEILGKTFRVVGVVSRIGNNIDDKSVMIPLDIMRDLTGEREKLSMIMLSVKDGYDVEDVAENIREELRKHRDEKKGEETFSVSTPKDLLSIFNQILLIVQIILIGVASISILVGGIGIMNTMYMAVLERTHEIGIMKSIGAKKIHILLIFLFESGILGMLGGILGFVIGFGISKFVEIAAASYMGVKLIEAYINPWLVVGSILFSFIVGVISGVLPAKQAAELKPVEALRYE